jgi:multidrug efflux pump subunit AcrB
VTLDGKPTIAMGIFLQTGANALEVAELGARQDGRTEAESSRRA